jgi:hypothetical protein
MDIAGDSHAEAPVTEVVQLGSVVVRIIGVPFTVSPCCVEPGVKATIAQTVTEQLDPLEKY